MIRRLLLSCVLSIIFIIMIIVQMSCANNEKKEMTKEELVKKGAYLVNLGGCNDCHSPKIMTQMGPIPDTTKLLSGHPENEQLPPIDASLVQPGKWYMSGADLTSWVGPWGVSFPANLTPDGPTGIGTWTDEVFIKAMRTGKHMGVGRPILPPMPWQSFGQTTDEDLKAIFAYLKSVPPVHNKVPEPIPPENLTALK